MPRTVRRAVEQELDAWASLGVDAHLKGPNPWYSYHERFRESGARLVGARPGEVVMMNTLTANLHLMMASFYRPQGQRTCIMVEDALFPSDDYAVESHPALPRRGPPGQHHPSASQARRAPAAHRGRPGGHRAGRLASGAGDARRGAVPHGPVVRHAGHHRRRPRRGRPGRLGLRPRGGQRAHGPARLAGRFCRLVQLQVPSTPGPGAIAGCFVHQRHADDPSTPRLAGWWGTDPATRLPDAPGLRAQARGRRLAAEQTRPSWPWPRWPPRWRSSTRSAWTPCATRACA
ncbi:MAG: hypothetical protein KatS3mg103_1337 [Phycisphaerales bacterium]|nr:MAG: hypothetical protein KatS3mg103_1337 [Phycisphaerales bacterium]